ncbi:MAG: LLM class flavin-dependent oxidoreductase, partial [Actinobacteria bacterium]|nr:LLM class flavin-dependent oxidoreductase [Actinomycetota bacterium]
MTRRLKGSTTPEPLGKYDEALEIITGLWAGEEFSFQGEFFQVDGA